MRQMQENPQLLQNAMQMPQMQEMMHQFSSNPELMNLLVSSNPLLANDPNLANQVRSQLPTIMSQMQNPEFQAAMTNPEVYFRLECLSVCFSIGPSIQLHVWLLVLLLSIVSQVIISSVWLSGLNIGPCLRR